MIQAQVGHVAPEMMKTYSHIRRQALNQAAAALEPLQSQGSTPSDTTGKAGQARRPAKRVITVHVTIDAQAQTIAQPSEIGSSGWIRTSNPPVNSRMLYH